MVSFVFACPHCKEKERVRRHGRTKQGSERLYCNVCSRTFTPHPRSRSLSAEKEQLILKALAQKTPMAAIARTFGVGRNTLYELLKKSVEPLEFLNKRGLQVAVEPIAMPKLVSDELWAKFEPLLPAPKPRRFRYPGRKPVDNRVALGVILHVLKTGVPWEEVPRELGCCGMAAWKKLRAWQEAGVWEAFHALILQELEAAGKLDWQTGMVDSSSVRATQGGEATGPNPTDRAKPGTKHHALTEGGGLPLATQVTSANINDITQLKITQLKPLVEAIPQLRTRGKGRQRAKRPKKLLGERGYDWQPHREWLQDRGILPKLAKRGTPHGSGLGKERWPVERLFAWVHDDRRLRGRGERREERRHSRSAGFLCRCAHLLRSPVALLFRNS